MKILIKPIAVILLGAYSFALGQDVYPYFSDSKKQFEFEEKRIYVKEIDEKEQVISGGAQFNMMRLIDNSAPLNIPAPVRTTYNYKYEFHILKNGKNLTEIEFLRLIGLEEEAEEILNDFSSKITLWEETPPKRVDVPDSFYGVPQILSGILIIVLTNDAHETDRPLGYITSAGLILWGIMVINYVQNTKNTFIKPPKPNLEQTLTNEQIQSLSESYNKRIYEEIKNAN